MKRKQLSDKVKNVAKRIGVSPEMVRRYYILEKVLELISHSKYKDKFVLKGGFLIGSYIGLGKRTTVDMDASVRELNLTKEEISSVFQELFEKPTKDGISFTIINVKEIREGDFYPGFRLQVGYNVDGVKDTVKLDISTGDAIIPQAVLHEHKMLFDEENVEIYAYPIEQILGEKLQTILARSTTNTRSRDFYDIYVLSKFHQDEFDWATLKKSFENTMKSRGTEMGEEEMNFILDLVVSDQIQVQLWQQYVDSHGYASGIAFTEVIKATHELIEELGKIT